MAAFPSRLALGPALLVALSVGLASCGEKELATEDPVPPIATTLARERVAARFERYDFEAARKELAPLVDAPEPAPADLLRAAAIEFALHEPTRAKELLDAAEAQGLRSPVADFLRGQMDYERGALDAAQGHLERSIEAAPDDLAARFALASVLQDRARFEEAEPLYRAIVAVGIENGETWYLAALHRLQRMLRGLGREADAAPLAARWEELAAAGVGAPSEGILRLGRIARAIPAEARGSVTVPAAEAPRFEAAPAADELAAVAGALELSAHDLDGDLRMDALARLSGSVVALLRTEHGWDPRTVFEGPSRVARAFDLDNDGDDDLVVFGDEGVSFLLMGDAGWERAELAHPPLSAPPTDAVGVDFDHEGDLDLLLVGPFGARLWRNDGAWLADGAFADATAEAGLPTDRGFAWCATEDFDGDDDVDFLLGGPDGVHLADNLRAGRFADRSAALGAGPRTPHRPLVADFDGDARPDLWIRGASEWWRQTREGSFARVATERAPAAIAGALDLDLDGALDVVWPRAAILAAGLPQERSVETAGWPAGEPRALCFADFDDDLVLDALGATEDAAFLLLGRGATGHAMRVRLVGAKDNERAVGAVIETRAGEIYRRIYYRGEPEIVGVGPHDRVDVFRVRWPNGLVQTQLGRDLADQTGDFALDESLGNFAQEQGLLGSCPFLYTWNGETYEFVTDVLGVTPLGLPLAPGRLVPFDHDEYVLVRGRQLVPRDGRLELVVTEELREVTYLDRVRLDAIDHPVGTEVQPNERFTFPPFPEPHVHSMRGALAPLRATGSDGGDWTAAVAAEDGVHAMPFERESTRLQGLAKPWFLELEFDRDAIARAPKLRLALTGWFDWADASVNVAAARQPGVDFVPPILSVPDGEGGWRALGPPVGFPAGKTKTMVIELSKDELGPTGRLRVACTLELYWDRVALAVDGDDAELRVTSLEPTSARLWLRGFSARVPTGREDLPELFDWERLAEHPRWDQHPGRYTRLGDCLELLGAIDDRTVILGAGDALTIAFDANALPPLAEGFERDYLVFFDGWAKDRDPNTLEALEVEPLPFHGMSTYPYPPDERFPDGEEHRRWRAEWNTRPARRWIEPLSPRVESEERLLARPPAGE